MAKLNTVHQDIGQKDSVSPASMAIDFINKEDAHGQTPLMIALQNHRIKNALILIDSGADIDIRYIQY